MYSWRLDLPSWKEEALRLRTLLKAAGLAMAAADRSPVAPFEEPGPARARGWIDELVFARLARLGSELANPCSDAVFLRRACLDVIGTLPTEAEASQFLADRDPNRRGALIERLLARDEFADYWALKWGDLLRVKSEFPINLWPNAVQAYARWIRTAIRDNKPYDQFARELLTASGSNFRVGPVNFYRAVQNSVQSAAPGAAVGKDPRAIAAAVALTFMGARFDQWPRERQEGMAAFFAQVGYKGTDEWKEEIVYFDQQKQSPAAAVFPDGRRARIGQDEDPRQVFAAWLTATGNPWFARAIVNRAWSWFMGRGIIQEPDDTRPDNPAVNPELLAHLEAELVHSGYDLRHVYRLILNSQTYQLSSIPRSADRQAAAHFASMPLRRLQAEVLIDAIDQITGATEQYASAVPEPYTFLPETQRSIALTDGSLGSLFLELFGRPGRDNGLESERNNGPTAEQRLHLLNSTHIQRKIQQSAKLRALLQGAPRPRDAADRLYLTILSRYPTEEELKTAAEYVQTAGNNRWPAAVDLAWALINSAEFLYRH